MPPIRRLWESVSFVYKLLNLLVSGALVAFVLDALDRVWSMHPVLLVIFGLCLTGAVFLGGLLLLDHYQKPGEGRAVLGLRYQPYDPSVNPSPYEVRRHFDEVLYRIGVHNAGPSVARNVALQVVDLYEETPEGGSIRFVDGFPIICRRADASSDLINPGQEGLYHLADLKDVVKESGGSGPRKMGYRFDWQDGFRLSLEGENTIVVWFRITAENADTMDFTVTFWRKGGERLIGHLSPGPPKTKSGV